MTTRHLFLIQTLILLLINPAGAQTRKPGLFRSNDFATNVYFQSWNVDGDRTSQLSVPVTYILPLSRKLNLDITTGAAFAQRTTAANRLDGPIDTRVRTSLLLLKEKLLLSAYLTFPTGKSKLGGDQNEVASALADDALGFRVPNYGHGLHLNLAVVYAQKISRGLVLGPGAAFLQKGEFEPFEDTALDYSPGHEIALTMGVDIGGSKFKMTGDVSYIIYQADKANDVEIFRSGNKLLLQAQWILNARVFGLTLYLRNRSKGKNERGRLFGDLEGETRNSNGNQLDVGSISSFAVGRKTTVQGFLSAKIYARNQFGDRGALIVSVGSGLKQRISRRLALEISARFSQGRLKTQDSLTNVTGIEVGGGFRIRLR